MILTTIVLLVLALFLIQIFLQETSRFGFDLSGIVGNRDNLPGMTVVAARLDRAKNNMLESLPLFLGLAMLAFVNGGDPNNAASGAMVFLIARALYVPAYVSGIPLLRSLIWLVGNIGLLMMALMLF
ncbi:MAG: MAPEG family protein [Rhodobacteraceae bacterium]|nr:MAPEG family protein [Paracoccaceae bacterium]